MSSTKSKIRLMSAFAALLALALAVGCRGFFPPATIQPINLQPPTPSFGVGDQQPMQAWATDSNSNHFQVTNGVTWELSSPSTGTVATITSTGTMTGVNAGSITVTASYEGVSGTTTASVVEVVSSMTITPSSTSVTDTGTAYAPFTITDQNGNNISSLVTLTAYQNGTAVGSGLPCAYELGLSTDTTNDCQPTAELVTVSTAYQIIVTYSGYTGPQVSATLTVNP